MTGDYIPAAVRQLVVQRARSCCEYCLIPALISLMPYEVDHIVAQKHGGLTQPENLALACTLCNKLKGTDLASIDPVTGEMVPLYHPRRDHWSDHFRLNGSEIVGLTGVGRATARLLQLNRPERLAEREILLAAGMLHISSSDQ